MSFDPMELDYDSSDTRDDGPAPKVAFFLGELPKLEDIPDIPRNGFEYIVRVMEERKKYEDVSISRIDSSRYAKNQTVFSPAESMIKKPATACTMPSLEWQLCQVADFSELRRKLSTLIDKQPQTNCPIVIPTSGHQQEYWCAFFLENEPILSIIATMNQQLKVCGIRAILTTIQTNHKLETHQGLWLYSLMASLKIPLTPNTQSLLRELAKLCSELRYALPETENVCEAATPFNLIICLIARYFNQMDLADEPNDDVLMKILERK